METWEESKKNYTPQISEHELWQLPNLQLCKTE